ncbi:MAG: hypothetical protein AAF542_17700 [Pseudomonadota bacterium]
MSPRNSQTKTITLQCVSAVIKKVSVFLLNTLKRLVGLPATIERTGASLRLIPYLLGDLFNATGNKVPMLAFGNIKGKMEY